MERHWMGRESPGQPGCQHLGSSERAFLWACSPFSSVVSRLSCSQHLVRQCHLPSALATPGLSSAPADLQPWVELSPLHASSVQAWSPGSPRPGRPAAHICSPVSKHQLPWQYLGCISPQNKKDFGNTSRLFSSCP